MAKPHALHAGISTICAGLLTAFALSGPASADVTGDQVRAAILRGVAHLKSLQRVDGSWPDYAHPGGVTALATYALLTSGVDPADEAVRRGLAALEHAPDRATYVVALKAMAWARAGSATFSGRLQKAVDGLVRMQQPTGGWGYGTPPEDPSEALPGLGAGRTREQLRLVYARTDASNTQFALMALAESERAGAEVPLEVWRKVERHLRATQLASGGWAYTARNSAPEDAYGSVTAAVLAGLYLANERLAAHESSAATEDRLKALQRGVDWLSGHYSLRENPGRGLAWYWFWLYSLERAGVTSGHRVFGGHDWFREGTELLVKGQRTDGSWTDRPYQTALALLFLAKGDRPVLIQRIEWQGRWGRDPRDLEHLTEYLGTRLGDEPVAWQVLRPDAGLEEYLAAPLLHVAGRGPLRMLAANVLRLREYVEQGGIVLFDPVRGDSAFTESVRRLAAGLFPGAEFEPLPPTHPLYHCVHDVPSRKIESLGLACREAVLLAPEGVSEEWARGDPERGNEALRWGENLAFYATAGRPLPERLHEVRILTVPSDPTPPRGALRIGQVQHGGDWCPRPFALPTLLKDMSRRFGVSVYDRPIPVQLADPTTETILANIGKFPVLYMVGHHGFELSEKERAALRAYLERGGFLWGEACCGRTAFDTAFRALLDGLFEDSRLERLPPDHPLYGGEPGFKIDRVRYSDAVRKTDPDLHEPVLYGLERGGHLVVVYSPYALGPGLDGICTWGARAVAPDDARRLAVNILLYGLTY